MVLYKAARETAPEFFMEHSNQDSWTFSVLFGFFSLGHERREAVYLMEDQGALRTPLPESTLGMDPDMRPLINRKTEL